MHTKVGPHTYKLTLDIVSVDRMLDRNSSPFRGPGLNPEVAAHIMDGAERCPRCESFRLEVIVPREDLGRVDEVRIAIHRHFEREQKKAFRELRRIVHDGHVATLFSLIFVAILLSIGQAIARLSDSFLATVASESMTVFSWVAMWRPAEIWIYKHWPLRRRRTLALRLSQTEVTLRETATESASPSQPKEQRP